MIWRSGRDASGDLVENMLKTVFLKGRLPDGMGCRCCVNFRQLLTCRDTPPGQQRASCRHQPLQTSAPFRAHWRIV